MFCQSCGTQNLDTAKFCERCGSVIGRVKENEVIEDNQILYSVTPKFNFIYHLGGTIIIILFTLAMIIFPLVAIDDDTTNLSGIFVILILVALVILGISAFFIKKQIDNRIYNFYKTKIIYKDSFLNLSEKEVKHKYIREITLSQTVFQRIFNLGTVILYTNAESGLGNGIALADLENVQEKYRAIKEIINV